MKQLTLFLLFFLLTMCSVFCQNRFKDIDSLYHALDTATLETDRVHSKVSLACQYASINIDSALFYANNVLTISRRISFMPGEARALDALGWVYYNTGNKALSMGMYFKSLKFAEKNNLPVEKSNALMMIGQIYLDEHIDYDKALNFIFKAKDLFNTCHEEHSVTVCETLIGSIYTHKRQLDSAEYYLRLAEAHEKKLKMHFNYVIWGHFGLLYKVKGNSEKALAYSRQAANQARFNGDYAHYCGYNIQIAQLYIEQNQKDSAIYFATVALNDAKKSKLNVYTIQASTMLNNLYKQIDPVKALYFNEITLAAQDSLYNSAKLFAMKNVFEFQEKEQKYEIEIAQKAYQNQIRMFALLTGLLIAFILYRNNRIKQKANRVLQEQKKKLESTLSELKATQTQLIEKEKMASLGALRLQELDAVKTRLYTNITHEFRTPLTVILGMAHQIMDKPQAYLADGLKMIVRNGQNLLNLVNQMLDLSKLEGGKLTLHYQQGDVVNYVRYITESFHSLGEKKDVRLLFLTELEHLIMDYEEMRLQQIVSNLLSNAVKFTPKGGFIYVSVSTKNNALVLKIKDTGIGISETDLPFIFDRFYQVDEAHTHEGTGIGLALTHELVKLLEGTISVKSEFGKGTEFEVTLPIRNVSEIQKELQIAVEQPISFDKNPISIEEQNITINHEDSFKEKPLVLITDDNADVRAYIASCLATDYRLIIAKDGQECEEIAFDTTPDLIVLDVMMPFKNGFDVCKTLKNDERTSHIPIIMLTAKADMDSKLNGLERGADAYLMKPFNKDELLLRIKKLLELRLKLQQYYLSTVMSANSPSGAGGTEGGDKDSKVLAAEKEALLINSFDNAFVLKVKKTIESHLADNHFDVEKLGRTLALSPSQVNRKLSALMGLTANSFIRTVRLMKSKEMLQHSGYSISAIAYDCGFNDPAYFSRAFKQAFGVTPQVWREENPVT